MVPDHPFLELFFVQPYWSSFITIVRRWLRTFVVGFTWLPFNEFFIGVPCITFTFEIREMSNLESGEILVPGPRISWLATLSSLLSINHVLHGKKITVVNGNNYNCWPWQCSPYTFFKAWNLLHLPKPTTNLISTHKFQIS